MQKILDEAAEGALSPERRIKLSIELAENLWRNSLHFQTPQEKKEQKELSGLIKSPSGKALLIGLLDQTFRSSEPRRIAKQLQDLIASIGIPDELGFFKKAALQAFCTLSPSISQALIPIIKHFIFGATARVMLPSDKASLRRHILKKKAEGMKINLNHLGEAILGENEAENRLLIYLDDLASPEVEHISVKISTLYSQIQLTSFETSLEKLSKPYRRLLREVLKSDPPKEVTLDMEEYRDLKLTVSLFESVLFDPEFMKLSPGIALQSYLPDSFEVLEHLIACAEKRASLGGAPLRIRLVKGANLAMEKVEGSLKGWPQAPFLTKLEVDAHFKKMEERLLRPEYKHCLKVGIASHNIFDIAHALVLSASRGFSNVCYEMLEGMADPLARTLVSLGKEVLLYCPVSSIQDFHTAIAYLIRRLDENTAPENFLRASFDLKTQSNEWHRQAAFFAKSCLMASSVSSTSHRRQNREEETNVYYSEEVFSNVADTDWTVPSNRDWVEKALLERQRQPPSNIPLLIGGEEREVQPFGSGRDPSTQKEVYNYSQATEKEIKEALEKADLAWRHHSDMTKTLLDAAVLMTKRRGELISAMCQDVGKSISEADAEISEAIDFLRYYAVCSKEIASWTDIDFKPFGVVAVLSPWNFPCSIPVGGIAAALGAGNAVIFKPAPEAVLIGKEIADIFYEAGVPKNLFHFLPCDDNAAQQLIQDNRIAGVILTGSEATARTLLKERLGLNLMAETGGKNSIIVTAAADRDLAVKEAVQSAFGFSGQKCSACSLLILEEEVYNDVSFQKQLVDAVSSLKVGSAWDPESKITPLIKPPEGALKQAFETLEEGEQWLLRPEIDSKNPHMMSPGIKWNLKRGGFTHAQELFGPILGVMKAKDLEEAIIIANETSYGLTAGLHSLDPLEQKRWLSSIRAGNCYINRGITGAIVRRQPFGGCKQSCFGPGAKAGGPHYVLQCGQSFSTEIPGDKSPLEKAVKQLLRNATIDAWSLEEQSLVRASAGNYQFHWKYFFSKFHDPSKVLGEDNLQRYLPRKRIEIRVSAEDSRADVIRAVAASLTVQTPVALSLSAPQEYVSWQIPYVVETEEEFVKRISAIDEVKVRLLKTPSYYLIQELSSRGLWVRPASVVSHGRVELLHYLQEQTISHAYHRYGNLGLREKE